MDHVAVLFRAWQEGQMGAMESTWEVDNLGATKKEPEEGIQHAAKAHRVSQHQGGCHVLSTVP